MSEQTLEAGQVWRGGPYDSTLHVENVTPESVTLRITWRDRYEERVMLRVEDAFERLRLEGWALQPRARCRVRT